MTPTDERGENGGVGEAARRGFDQGVDEGAEAGGGECGAEPVEVACGFVVAAFGDEAECERENGDRDRHVDEEGRAPGNMFDEPAAHDGADGGGDGGEGGPGADRVAAFVFREGGGDDREAAGDEQRAADSLHCAGGDQLRDAGREAAPDGREREERDADVVNPAAAEVVAERSADEKQRGEEERVGFDDPLHVDGGGVECGLERREGDVDDGAVDEGEAGAEDGGGEYVGACGFSIAHGRVAVCRPFATAAATDAFVARWWKEGGHGAREL